MNRRRFPYLFLFFLFVILMFILGVRYGKQVEQTNKAIDYVLATTPKPTSTPEPLKFSLYTNKDCGIQFLIPSSFKKEKDSSQSADFTDNGKTAFNFSCTQNSIIQSLKDNKTATEELKLKNQKLTAKTITENKFTLMSFTLKNPLNGKKITVEVDKNFYPLFENTLQFLQ